MNSFGMDANFVTFLWENNVGGKKDQIYWDEGETPKFGENPSIEWGSAMKKMLEGLNPKVLTR